VRKRKTYLSLAVILSVLFGIILPIALGVKDLTLIAVIFSSVWLIYVIVLLFITLLIVGRRNLKKRSKEGINDRWGFS